MIITFQLAKLNDEVIFWSKIDVDLLFHTYLQSSLIALLSVIYFDCLIQPFICASPYISFMISISVFFFF